MALAVADTIEQGGALVVEAGTGVGKTFSYLVPALLVRRAGAAVHRHQDLAGPAVRPRPAAPGRGARPAGAHRAAQGPRQLPVPASPGAGAPGSLRLPTAASLPRWRRIEQWAQGTRTGDLAELAGPGRALARDPARDLHARQLPGRAVPEVPRLPRQPGAARGACRGRGRHQPPPVLRRPRGARIGHGRTAAHRARRHLRRGAPAQRDRRAVPRRPAGHRRSCWTSRATCWPPACSWRAAWSTGSRSPRPPSAPPASCAWWSAEPRPGRLRWADAAPDGIEPQAWQDTLEAVRAGLRTGRRGDRHRQRDRAGLPAPARARDDAGRARRPLRRRPAIRARCAGSTSASSCG